MQKISALIGNPKRETLSGSLASPTAGNTTNQAATSSPLQNEDFKRINDLFLKFGSYYGAVWRKQLGAEEFLLYVKKEWQQALLHFDDRVVSLAILSCRNSRVLPPTLPQFITICQDIRRRDALFIREAPESSPRNLEVAKRHLRDLKQMLSGYSNQA